MSHAPSSKRLTNKPEFHLGALRFVDRMLLTFREENGADVRLRHGTLVLILGDGRYVSNIKRCLVDGIVVIVSEEELRRNTVSFPFKFTR